jgi:hypothetical protein
MNAVEVCIVALSFTNVTMCFKERLILMIHALSIRTLRTSPLTENLMRLFDDCTEKLLCIVISYAACSNARYLESANLTPGSIGMWLPHGETGRLTERGSKVSHRCDRWVRKEKEDIICKVNEVRNFIRCQTRFVKWAEGSQIATCLKCDRDCTPERQSPKRSI